MNDTFLEPFEFLNENSIQDYMLESVVPACCKWGCEVEPDGYCPHGNPSVLIELNLI